MRSPSPRPGPVPPLFGRGVEFNTRTEKRRQRSGGADRGKSQRSSKLMSSRAENTNEYDLRLLSMGRALGPLEADVMEIVWNSGQATVRDVYELLLGKRQIAYTTVLTILRNLTRKQMVCWRREGKTYVYCATIGKDEFVRSRVEHIVDVLLDGFPKPTVSRFQQRLGQKGEFTNVDTTI